MSEVPLYGRAASKGRRVPSKCQTSALPLEAPLSIYRGTSLMRKSHRVVGTQGCSLVTALG